MTQHTGTFQTRQNRTDRICLFGAAMVVLGGIGGFTGAETSVMTSLILGGFGLVGGSQGHLTHMKTSHDKGKL